MNDEASSAAVGFEHDSLGALDSLQGFADRVGLAPEHFQLGALAEVGGRFVGAAESILHDAAVVEGPRVATAALNGGVQRVEGPADIAGEEGVHAAAVQLFEHGVLSEATRRGESQEGGDQRQESGHERTLHGRAKHFGGNTGRDSAPNGEEPAFIVVRASRACKQGRGGQDSCTTYYGSFLTLILR
jgi:hypothetical protein